MGILSRAFGSAEGEKALSIIDLIKGTDAYRPTFSGKSVTVESAVRVSTVFACMRVLGEGVAQVPLKLMRQDIKTRTRLPAYNHPLFDLLAYSPNGWQTSFEFREQIVWHAGLTGNAFIFVNRNGQGDVLELIPLAPGAVTVKQSKDWALSYTFKNERGEQRDIPAEAMWHIRGPSLNGFQGLDCVKIAREAIGLSMAIEDSQATMHKNGTKPSGVYSVDSTLKPDQWRSLRDWIVEQTGGSENAGKPMVLDRAAKWMQTSMSNIDAQTLETRRYQVEEVCRFARVNPIMVGAESKNTTYASAEQMFLAHVVHTLAPWFQRIEQSIDKNLLSEADRRNGIYSNFVEEGLLRGSAVTTKDVLLGYVNGGMMTANEGRGMLDLNPDSSPESDKLRVPANIVGLGDHTDERQDA